MKLQTIFAILTVLLLTVVLVEPSFAQAENAGQTALNTLTKTVTGNLGLLIGLGLAIGGLWTWIVGQNTSVGLLMIAGGIMLTLSPSVFNGAQKLVAPVITTFAGGSAVTQGSQITNPNQNPGQ